MKNKVFVTRYFPGPGIEMLKEHCEVNIYPENRAIPRDELINGVKWCDILLCLATDKIGEDVISANPNLKFISNWGVGYDNVDVEAATGRNIPVTNTPGVMADTTAEHAIVLMMAIAKRIPEADRFTRAGKFTEFSPNQLVGVEMKGKTLGIVGLGRIGSGVAERATKGLHMNIIYSDIRRDLQFEEKYEAKFVELDCLLEKSDFVTIHVPLLSETRHLIGKEQLKKMKKRAYLINTSRGPTVDEKALVEALKKGEIAGAALDVFEFEPRMSEGLAELDNVVLTPHTGSATHEARAMMSELAARNILDFLGGKIPQCLVNKETMKSV